MNNIAITIESNDYPHAITVDNLNHMDLFGGSANYMLAYVARLIGIPITNLTLSQFIHEAAILELAACMHNDRGLDWENPQNLIDCQANARESLTSFTMAMRHDLPTVL